MPTKNRIEATLDELAEVIESVGDDVHRIEGPQELEDDEGVEHTVYYLFGESDDSRFYLTATTELDHMAAFYPYSVARRIGQITPEEERELILSDLDIDEDAEELGAEELEFVGEQIIDQTPDGIINRARFNIAAYGSSDLVDLQFEGQSDIGFFRTARAMYPYTEKITIRNVNDRIMASVHLGKRASRYVRSSFYVSKDDIDGEEKLIMKLQF